MYIRTLNSEIYYLTLLLAIAGGYTKVNCLLRLDIDILQNKLLNMK